MSQTDDILAALDDPEVVKRVGREMAMAVFDQLREVRAFNRLRLAHGLPALPFDEAWADIERLKIE